MAHRSTAPWLVPALLGSAAVLGAAALHAAARTREAERRTPPVGATMTVDGVRLHYLVRGHGQPLVLIHGNGTLIQDFLASGIVEALAERYRVILFDRPGYGYSDRPRGVWTPRAQAALLAKALERLGVSKAFVLGHSWGSLVAVALALQTPGAVRSLVLASGYYFPTLRADAALATPSAVPGLGDVLRHTVSPLLGRATMPGTIKALFAPAPVPDRFRRDFPTAMMLRPLQLRASAEDATLMVPAAAAMQAHYRDLTLPVVILAGAEDRIADVGGQSERLHRSLPRSAFVRVPRMGHMIHHLAPEETVAAIDRSLAMAHAPAA